MSGKNVRTKCVVNRTKKLRRLKASLRIEPLEQRHLLAFTPGNLVVERVGDGGLPIATAKPLALFEFTNAANQTLPVSTVGLPASNAGANNQGWVTDSSKSQTNGHLHLSTDGRYLTLIGYDALLDTSAVNSTDASAVNRNVARIDAAGNVTIAARLADAYDSTNGMHDPPSLPMAMHFGLAAIRASASRAVCVMPTVPQARRPPRSKLRAETFAMLTFTAVFCSQPQRKRFRLTALSPTHQRRQLRCQVWAR